MFINFFSLFLRPQKLSWHQTTHNDFKCRSHNVSLLHSRNLCRFYTQTRRRKGSKFSLKINRIMVCLQIYDFLRCTKRRQKRNDFLHKLQSWQMRHKHQQNFFLFSTHKARLRITKTIFLRLLPKHADNNNLKAQPHHHHHSSCSVESFFLCFAMKWKGKRREREWKLLTQPTEGKSRRPTQKKPKVSEAKEMKNCWFYANSGSK